MIEPQILYGVTCDRCGETLINSNDNSAWYDRSTAEEEASEEDWHSVSSHHYCPNCYREDDDGNRTIKAPFPYYVQKINRFMNRIAKSYPCRIVEEDDHFALHGNTQDGKQLAPCDEEWVRSYACRRLETCRYGPLKGSCKQCTVHCYAPAQREKIRAVMRYAGPRMLLYHPLEALRHLLR